MAQPSPPLALWGSPITNSLNKRVDVYFINVVGTTHTVNDLEFFNIAINHSIHLNGSSYVWYDKMNMKDDWVELDQSPLYHHVQKLKSCPTQQWFVDGQSRSTPTTDFEEISTPRLLQFIARGDVTFNTWVFNTGIKKWERITGSVELSALCQYFSITSFPVTNTKIIDTEPIEDFATLQATSVQSQVPSQTGSASSNIAQNTTTTTSSSVTALVPISTPTSPISHSVNEPELPGTLIDWSYQNDKGVRVTTQEDRLISLFLAGEVHANTLVRQHASGEGKWSPLSFNKELYDKIVEASGNSKHVIPYYPYSYQNMMKPSFDWPKSTALYNSLVSQFGARAIKPIPDTMLSDNERYYALKRSENALLYFFKQRKHYKETVQKIMDAPLLCVCCSAEQVNKNDKYTGIKYCVAESLLCSATWCFIRSHREKMYANQAPVGSEGCCCPLFCGGIAFRQMFIKRIKLSGIKYHENWCGSCLRLTFCQPCVATQTQHVIHYVYHKRHGLGALDNTRPTAIECSQVPDPMLYTYRSGRRHRSEFPQRECGVINGEPVNDLFHEFYNPKGAIETHNRLWKGLHELDVDLEMS